MFIDWDEQVKGNVHYLDGRLGLYITSKGDVYCSQDTPVSILDDNGSRHWYSEAHEWILTESKFLIMEWRKTHPFAEKDLSILDSDNVPHQKLGDWSSPIDD